MESNHEDLNFFGLISELCKCLLGKYRSERPHEQTLYKMRRKAFEIILKKHPKTFDLNDNQQNEDSDDSISTLFKSAFVMKTQGSVSKATNLEEALDNLLCDDSMCNPSIKVVLDFLYCLKNYESTSDRDDLEIFCFDKKHPALPESIQSPKEVPHYQIYPPSAFSLPYKIDQLLQLNCNKFTSVNFEEPFSCLSQRTVEISSREFSMTSSLMPYDLKVVGCIEGGFEKNYTETEIESLGNLEDSQSESIHSHELSPTSVKSQDTSWSESLTSFSETERRTWETLGHAEMSSKTNFALESKIALYHIQNFTKLLSSSNEPSSAKNKQCIVITCQEFMENVKLVLLGIESSCYIWDKNEGFIFQSNTVVSGLSKESLMSISSDVTYWATCFKLLSQLVRPIKKSNQPTQNGLIFKAMVNNVDDILIHYQAVILQVFNNTSRIELLDVLRRLRDVGLLIAEVARLCHCDKMRQRKLHEGTGILSHIYDQVTKITKPNIALVYYSILKSCCEVYFQLLERWIFEGDCDEAYGEFMIKIRDQYLRIREHKFWTKCYGINKESVPGFLKNITDTILQCGKAVRLLKICDPKNKLCSLFVSERPKVRVCLSVNMLSEQEENCQHYLLRGIEILGTNITVSAALREMKAMDKVRADYVIAAQYETLQRIKKDQEDAKLLIVKNKRELLADQKKQLEDAVSRREKAKEEKLKEERLFVEKQLAEEERIKAAELAESKLVVNYYKELAEEARKRQLRATWRTKRLALFDERVSAIILAKRNDKIPIVHDIEPEKMVIDPQNDEQKIANVSVSSENLNGDENRNKLDLQDDPEPQTNAKLLNRPHRPTLLPVKSTETAVPVQKTTSNIPETISITDTESILNEIKECNSAFLQSQTKYYCNNETKEIDRDETDILLNNNSSSIIVLDKEGNEKTIVIKSAVNQDPNENNETQEKSNMNILTSENVNCNGNNRNYLVNNPEARQLSLVAGNNLDDATPMSCTTDSYVPSAIGSSLFHNCTEVDSKHEFETPTTPGDYLTKYTMKQGYSVDNIFSRSNSQFFSAPSLDDKSPAAQFESSLTTADVEMIDNTSLQVYLEKSVLIPLRVQSQLANSAVVKCLIHDHKLLEHFQSLRSFFFLLNGEFAKNLTGPLYTKFYEISMPDKLFNSATLASLLDNALHCSLNSSYKNSELLSLTVTKKPSQLRISDPEALNCLCLRYKIGWPANIIIDDLLMQQYSKVFQFLIMVGRVLWVLQEDFCILKNERISALSYQYHRLQLFRHAMMQFMTALHNYLTCSVLHASWAEFEKDLEGTVTLDQIYATHVTYIKKILSRCMLTKRGEKLRSCLRTIFELILKFHNTLRSHQWLPTSNGHVHPNYSKLEKMYEAFCTMRTYPAQVVDRYTTSGYQMHLSHFLDALNINPLFTL